VRAEALSISAGAVLLGMDRTGLQFICIDADLSTASSPGL
jgi:hypothetical protein